MEGFVARLSEYAALPKIPGGVPSHILEARKPFESLALAHLERGERRACGVFDCFYAIQALELPQATDVRPEWRVGRYRVDRAIFPPDGSLVVVEIKDEVEPRSVAAGIGQALLYASAAEASARWCPVIPALAVLADWDVDIARACERAGVRYVPLGSAKYLMVMSRLVAAAFRRRYAGEA